MRGQVVEQASPPSDSLVGERDTLLPPPQFFGSTASYKISEDSLTAPVTYEARDSMFVDFDTEEIHLFGEAAVAYQDINLKAGHIILNYGTNIVNAEGYRHPDSVGLVGIPEFSDGGQSFTAREMRYNFKSRKGIVHNTTTTQEDIFVRGGKSKFVSGAVAIDDTTSADVIYSEGAIFTTCSAEHPHFGIRTQRAKVIPNKLAVIGASNLEIMGVPTPFWLPFGFFPLKSGRSTGLLFPSDYQYSPQWGFGLQGVGWFFPIGEHVNLQLTADYYIKGTFTANTSVTYRRRYKYSGNFNASFRSLRQESRELVERFDRGISVNWSHRQDQRAHPTFNFGGSINFSTNLVDQRFDNSYEAASRNTTRSSMNLTKTFPKLKSTLTAGLTHSQNASTREINVTLPNVKFQTQTIYPLRELPGKQSAWYKKLAVRYRNSLENRLSAIDTSFFSAQTLDDARYGFQHDASASLSFNVLKYFNASPSINYAETYYGKTSTFDLDGNIEQDTIVDPVTGEEEIVVTNLGDVISELNPGIASFREYSASMSVRTQLFGKVKFKRKGIFGLQGLRHVMKPSISVSYRPNNQNARDFISGLPYFIRRDEIDPLNGGDQLLSPFDGQIFGVPQASEGNIGIGYSIANLFEAKVWNKTDSVSQNVPLFQNISVNGSYNPAAPKFKWSPVRVSGGTRLFKGVTNVNVSAILDPYISRFDAETNSFRRADVFNFDEGRFPLALDRFSTTISTNLTVDKFRQLFQGAEEEVVTDLAEERRQRREEDNTLFEETDILSLFERFSIRHNYNFGFVREFDEENPTTTDRGTPTFRTVANSIELRGSLQLTNNWSVNIGQIGYSFTDKRITYPFLSFVRDLHCWEMRFSWAPQRNTYSFSIAVKPGTLDFINLPVNQNRYDGGQLFGN